MRNKVLIVNANAEEKAEFEKILEKMVDDGGEIFFAEKKEDGLSIIRNEHPQLVFLDRSLMGSNEKEWEFEGVHVVVLLEKKEEAFSDEDAIFKPLKRHRVLEKCRGILENAPAKKVPPM